MLTPHKQDALDSLKLFVENIKHLPSSAWTQPVTHYDLAAAMELVVFILSDSNAEDNGNG